MVILVKWPVKTVSFACIFLCSCLLYFTWPLPEDEGPLFSCLFYFTWPLPEGGGLLWFAHVGVFYLVQVLYLLRTLSVP